MVRLSELAENTFLLETEGGHKIRHDKTAISLEASKALNTPAGCCKILN